jgi:putative ABC transport system permease protein
MAPGLFRLLFDAMVRLLAARNLRSDRFGTLAAVLGVALGAATVNVVVVLDVNTVAIEAASWASNPGMPGAPDTIGLRGVRRDGTMIEPESARRATHEDYEIMRSAIRLGSLAAFLVGGLIVFFTFGVVVDRRRREVALLRSLGALPRQVAAIFVREALIIGIAGAALGFLAAVPMSYAAALGGITTTGRARINVGALVFPWGRMALISAVGAGMALLGVLRPARDVRCIDVPRTLRPRFLDEDGARAARRTRGVTLIALPFMLLVYVLMRPFFRRALPSLTFFVIEAGLVCAAFLATLVLVPELVRRLGGLMVRLIPAGPAAERLLIQRRVEQMGHELAWSVSGVMLVFALLLALHIATASLKREVLVWAGEALHEELYVLPWEARWSLDRAMSLLPAGAPAARFSGTTPWPNAIRAVAAGELVTIADEARRPELSALARRLGPGKIVLSTMMARRFRVGEGDQMELAGRGGARRLEIVAVTDGLGFVPISAPYRNAKTYGVIDAADADLIAPYADPIGAALVLGDGRHPEVMRWGERLRAHPGSATGLRFTDASSYRTTRVRETDRDFVIFDLILALTSVLAAVGIANQLILSVRARAREIALYRVLGMTARQVRRLVMMEGAFVGLLGGALAAALGAPLGYAAIGALRAVSAFQVDYQLPPHYALYTVVGSVLIAVASSVYPASQAARADSAESVHYE